jgi:hypothetical protein
MKNKKIFLKLLKLKKKELITKFDFSFFNSGEISDKNVDGKIIKNCGTSACLAGNLPQFSDEWSFDKNGNLMFNGCTADTKQLGSFFDIDRDVINIMFYPNVSYDIVNEKIILYGRGNWSPDDESSLKEVQDHIKFIMKECPQYFED